MPEIKPQPMDQFGLIWDCPSEGLGDKVVYRVDLESWACTCPEYLYRVSPKQKDLDDPTSIGCKHIYAAFKTFAWRGRHIFIEAQKRQEEEYKKQQKNLWSYTSMSEFREWMERKQKHMPTYKGLKPMSDKQRERQEEYTKLRKAHLKANPLCEVGCKRKSTEIHHMGVKGEVKRKSNLNNVDTWLAVCKNCHRKIEANKTWARENGYLA